MNKRALNRQKLNCPRTKIGTTSARSNEVNSRRTPANLRQVGHYDEADKDIPGIERKMKEERLRRLEEQEKEGVTFDRTVTTIMNLTTHRQT